MRINRHTHTKHRDLLSRGGLRAAVLCAVALVLAGIAPALVAAPAEARNGVLCRVHARHQARLTRAITELGLQITSGDNGGQRTGVAPDGSTIYAPYDGLSIVNRALDVRDRIDRYTRAVRRARPVSTRARQRMLRALREFRRLANDYAETGWTLESTQSMGEFTRTYDRLIPSQTRVAVAAMRRAMRAAGCI